MVTLPSLRTIFNSSSTTTPAFNDGPKSPEEAPLLSPTDDDDVDVEEGLGKVNGKKKGKGVANGNGNGDGNGGATGYSLDDEDEGEDEADEGGNKKSLKAQEAAEDLAWKRRRWGFYIYSWAMDAYALVSGGLFIPITLESLAKQHGSLSPYHDRPCLAPNALPSFNSTSLSSSLLPTSSSLFPTSSQPNHILLPSSSSPPNSLPIHCAISLFNGTFWIDTASFALFVYAAGVGIGAIVVVGMVGRSGEGGASGGSGGKGKEKGGEKKDHSHLLPPLTLLGSFSSILFLLLPLSSPSLWGLSAILAILCNVSYGAVTVCNNGVLAGLGKWEEERVERERRRRGVGGAERETREEVDSSSSSSTNDNDDRSSSHSPSSTTPSKPKPTTSSPTSRISAKGIACAYSAGAICLILLMIPVNKMGGSVWSMRIAIGTSGVWWAFWGGVAFIFLFSGPGPLFSPSRLFKSSNSSNKKHDHPNRRNRKSRNLWSLIRHQISTTLDGYKLVWEMVKRASVLRDTFAFLGCWFLLSDGFATITSTAILFASTSLSVPPSSLMIVTLLVPIFGVTGAIFWPYAQKNWIKISNLGMFQFLLGLALTIPLYGLLGVLGERWGWKWGGLTNGNEMFAVGSWFGFLMGGWESYSRTVYAELIPPNHATQFFALFSVTSKSAAFLGPLLVGIISNATGNIRFGFLIIFAMLILPFPILKWVVNPKRGRMEAEEWEREVEKEEREEREEGGVRLEDEEMGVGRRE